MPGEVEADDSMADEGKKVRHCLVSFLASATGRTNQDLLHQCG